MGVCLHTIQSFFLVRPETARPGGARLELSRSEFVSTRTSRAGRCAHPTQGLTRLSSWLRRTRPAARTTTTATHTARSVTRTRTPQHPAWCLIRHTGDLALCVTPSSRASSHTVPLVRSSRHRAHNSLLFVKELPLRVRTRELVDLRWILLGPPLAPERPQASRFEVHIVGTVSRRAVTSNRRRTSRSRSTSSSLQG